MTLQQAVPEPGGPSVVLRYVLAHAADLLRWPVWLVRDLPARAARLRAAPTRNFAGSDQALPRVLLIGIALVDLVGMPELVEFFWRFVGRMSGLNPVERDAGAAVLGSSALDWNQVRIVEGGLLLPIFARNQQRAFTLFHTINLPSAPGRGRDTLDLVVHELTHVYQYERLGSAYIAEALAAQARAGYDYGGIDGLRHDRQAGRTYQAYNREQQAQIAQDYYRLSQARQPIGDYEPCIAELRAGEI